MVSNDHHNVKMIMISPCSGCAAGVNVDVDPVAIIRRWHEHVLARVVP